MSNQVYMNTQIFLSVAIYIYTAKSGHRDFAKSDHSTNSARPCPSLSALIRTRDDRNDCQMVHREKMYFLHE